VLTVAVGFGWAPPRIANHLVSDLLTNASAVGGDSGLRLYVDAQLSNPFALDVVVNTLAFDFFVEATGGGCNDTIGRYDRGVPGRAGRRGRHDADAFQTTAMQRLGLHVSVLRMDAVPLGVNETVCINTPPVTISTGSADCIREAASAGKLEASIKQGQVRGAASARPPSPNQLRLPANAACALLRVRGNNRAGRPGPGRVRGLHRL